MFIASAPGLLLKLIFTNYNSVDFIQGTILQIRGQGEQGLNMA